MDNQFTRTEMLIGEQAVNLLADKKVIVFGLGGVGGHCCEALARTGIGCLTVVDKDIIDVTNINRQIFATHSVVGLPKVQVAKARLADINPNLKITATEIFVTDKNIDSFGLENYDYIVDAIDNVTAKLALISKAQSLNIPIISAMGAGNKLDPTQFTVTDISLTKGCPLARVMRRELKKRGIEHQLVVYSPEQPVRDNTLDGRIAPSSIAFVPSVMGLLMARTVILDLIKGQNGTLPPV